VTARAALPRSLVLRCRFVVPGNGPPIPGGWLEIAAGRIVAVGRGRPPGRPRDAGDCLAVAGFVNAHTHLEFSALERPFAVEGGLPAWIARVVEWRRRHPGDPAPLAAAIVAGLAESAADGVTSLGEISSRLPTGLPALLGRSGPRIRAYRESLGLSAHPVPRLTAGLIRDLDRLSAAGVAAGVSPHAPYSVSTRLGRRLLAVAAARRLPVAMHLAEAEGEAELVREGRGPFRELLDRLGAWPGVPPRLLSARDWISALAGSRRGLVVHATWLANDEVGLARLARHRDRLGVVVCPRTTMALSGRLPPLERLRAAGVRVALGTDGRGSSPDLSLRAECRALVDGGLASPEEALRMATSNGAWALGFERTGALAAGMRADLVLLRPESPGRPAEQVLDPRTLVVAVFRSGRIIGGGLEEEPGGGRGTDRPPRGPGTIRGGSW